MTLPKIHFHNVTIITQRQRCLTLLLQPRLFCRMYEYAIPARCHSL